MLSGRLSSPLCPQLRISSLTRLQSSAGSAFRWLLSSVSDVSMLSRPSAAGSFFSLLLVRSHTRLETVMCSGATLPDQRAVMCSGATLPDQRAVSAVAPLFQIKGR